MVSAWVLVALAALGSVACGFGAARLARAPKRLRQPGSTATTKQATTKQAAAKQAAAKQARR